MPYSNPTSPAASSTASFVLPPPPPSTRRAHSSAEAPEGSSTRRSYHSHSSTPYWQSTLPRATLPRRATSSSPGSVKAVVGGSGPGAGEVVSPPAPPGLILPRRTSHKAAAPKEQQQPQQQSDGTSDGGLGLSITTTPSGSTVDLQSPRSPPLADQPARRPSPSRPHSSPTASNLHSRRANSSNPTSLRVDIPAHHHHAPAHAVSRSSSEHGRHGETLGGGSSAHSGGSDRPAPAMVRKKSGEVVKSSLKRRSTSTPSSAGPETGPEESSGGYWERARSEPPTPHSESTPTTPGTAERRQLRFAGDSDDDGAGDSHGQLAKVVLFKREHKVTAVTRALAGEALDQIGTGTDTETETDSWWPGGSGRGGSSGGSRGLHHNGGANANRAREKVEMDWSHSTKIPRIPGLNLTVGSSRPLSVPEYDSVVLESVSLVDEGSGANATLNLRGSLVVRNLSFVKRVAVRFSKTVLLPGLKAPQLMPAAFSSSQRSTTGRPSPKSRLHTSSTSRPLRLAGPIQPGRVGTASLLPSSSKITGAKLRRAHSYSRSATRSTVRAKNSGTRSAARITTFASTRPSHQARPPETGTAVRVTRRPRRARPAALTKEAARSFRCSSRRASRPPLIQQCLPRSQPALVQRRRRARTVRWSSRSRNRPNRPSQLRGPSRRRPAVRW